MIKLVCSMCVKYYNTYLGSKWYKLRKVLVIEFIKNTHVFAVAHEPVDRGKVFALCKLFIQTPKYLPKYIIKIDIVYYVIKTLN